MLFDTQRLLLQPIFTVHFNIHRRWRALQLKAKNFLITMPYNKIIDVLPFIPTKTSFSCLAEGCRSCFTTYFIGMEILIAPIIYCKIWASVGVSTATEKLYANRLDLIRATLA